MADLKYYDVILKPVVTEKSMTAMAEKKYTFYVNPDATKTQIKEAVEKMFPGTKVASVNTMNCPTKTKRRGMTFGKTMDLDIGLKYQALAQDKIDVMVIFTTDGQLSQADAVVLEDDLGFYPSYLCGNVVRSEVLKEHPELQAVFDKLTGIITDAEMAEMNYMVESEGLEPSSVAAQFLREKGVLQ